MTPEVTLKYNPGDSIPDKIELGTGRYALKIYNDTTLLDEIPVFYKDTIFDIEAGKVNYLSVEVPMINIGVRLALPEGFSDWFKTYSFNVSDDGNRSVSIANGETAYFTIDQDISYTLSVTNNDDEQMTDSKAITKDQIAAGTIYVITYDYATKALRLLEP